MQPNAQPNAQANDDGKGNGKGDQQGPWSSIPTERFTKIFHSERRNPYTAKLWARDLKRYMREVASRWNNDLKTRITRESIDASCLARKFFDEQVPEGWLEAGETFDFGDGDGNRHHQPWEIIMKLTLRNYGPEKVYEDYEKIAKFQQLRYTPGQRMKDFISEYEAARIKAEELEHTMSVTSHVLNIAKLLHIRQSSDLWLKLIDHCQDSPTKLPTTEAHYRSFLEKLKVRDELTRLSDHLLGGSRGERYYVPDGDGNQPLQQAQPCLYQMPDNNLSLVTSSAASSSHSQIMTMFPVVDNNPNVYLPWNDGSSAAYPTMSSNVNWREAVASVFNTFATEEGQPEHEFEEAMDDDSSGSEYLDQDVSMSDVQNPSDDQLKTVFLQYLFAKKRWRYASKRRQKKGGGKRFGFGRKHYRPKHNLSIPEQAYFKQKGKGRQHKSPMNPRKPNGERIPCKGCGATNHWEKNCPVLNGSGAGKGGTPNFWMDRFTGMVCFDQSGEQLVPTGSYQTEYTNPSTGSSSEDQIIHFDGDNTQSYMLTYMQRMKQQDKGKGVGNLTPRQERMKESNSSSSSWSIVEETNNSEPWSMLVPVLPPDPILPPKENREQDRLQLAIASGTSIPNDSDEEDNASVHTVSTLNSTDAANIRRHKQWIWRVVVPIRKVRQAFRDKYINKAAADRLIKYFRTKTQLPKGSSRPSVTCSESDDLFEEARDPLEGLEYNEDTEEECKSVISDEGTPVKVITCTACLQNEPKKHDKHTYDEKCKYIFDYTLDNVIPTTFKVHISIPYMAGIPYPTDDKPTSSSSDPIYPSYGSSSSKSESQLHLERLMVKSDIETKHPADNVSESQKKLNQLLKTDTQDFSEKKKSTLTKGLSTTKLSYWPVVSESDANIFLHERTRLSSEGDGRDGLLVDCGAIGNLSGERTAQRLADKCKRFGIPYKRNSMTNTVRVEGVGKEHQEVKEIMTIPTCIGGDIGLFRAPIVPDSDIPNLLGLATMEQHRTFLDIAGRKYIIPGPGTVQVTLPKGSKILNLEKAPSGHLILPCDQWKQLNMTAEEANKKISAQTAMVWNTQFKVMEDNESTEPTTTENTYKTTDSSQDNKSKKRNAGQSED